jgi:aminopeptidase N
VHQWRDIWLNEGFATFMEVRYDETHGGPDGQEWLQSTWDGFSSDGFWKLPISDPGAADLFAPQVYTRGAMTLQALRHRVGEAAFWTILRTWTDEHAGGNGSTEDFVALAEDASGQDLDGFFDAWLVAPTRPAHTAANGF